MPWLRPPEQHAYGSMPAAAVDKVFEHLHAAHDALARVVGRRQPSPAGTEPAEGDPPESGKWLRPAVLRYDTLAACAPAAYQADAARHGIRSEAAHRLAEELRGASPGFRPTTQGQLQEELERQAAALEEDIRQLRALLAADCKRAIKDFWRRDAPDIAQRWKAVPGAIEVEAPGPPGLWNVQVPNTQTLLTEAHDVMFAVCAFWRELYDKRPVDLPGFQAVLARHVLRVPDGAWTQVQQYSMQDLQSALDKADGEAPGPNHVEARFIKALSAPVQWLLVHFIPGHPPRRPATDALEGRAHLSQPQGAGLRQTGRLQAHSAGPAAHEAAHGLPHPAHHGSADTARSCQRLAARGPPWLQHRPPTVPPLILPGTKWPKPGFYPNG